MPPARTAAYALMAILAALAATAGSVRAQMDCVADAGREAVLLQGQVAGQDRFTYPFAPGLSFVLAPVPGGWAVRVETPDGRDLSALTPPLHIETNPRLLLGWHFRNADNTGANRGDVNAPQHRRDFIFGPDVPDALDSGDTAGLAAAAEAAQAFGQGTIALLDHGLADLERGQRARMVYLRFDACLRWPAGGGNAAPVPDDAVPSPAPTAERLDQAMRACGLDADLSPDPFLVPSHVQADFDADGLADLAVPVLRPADGKRAVAVCLAGGRLHVLGLAGEMGHLLPAYFDRMDTWLLHPPGPAGQGVGEGPPPTLAGSGIVLGIAESSSVLVYWNGTRFDAYWQGD